MVSMKVSIIIPNYNGEALLGKNIPAIFKASQFFTKETHAAIEIIVIDDASTDASRERLQILQKGAPAEISFSVILNEENKGFAPTVNTGVKKASGDILVLLNTDVSPSENFLVPLLSHFSDEKVFAVGAMDKSIEHDTAVLRGRGIGSWKRGFLMHSAGELDKTNSLWVSCGSGAFRKTVWDILGGLDELYAPFYWEDIDISYRALKAGYRVMFARESIVTHEHEKGAIKSKYTQDAITSIAYRNQFIFVWKNADSTMIWFHIVWLPYHVLLAIKRSDKNFLNGLWSAIKLLPKIRKARSTAQKQFFSSDYAIIARYKA